MDEALAAAIIRVDLAFACLLMLLQVFPGHPMFGLFRLRRARRDHAAAMRVLNHACTSREFRGNATEQIRALDALNLWHRDRIEPPLLGDVPFERTPDAAPSPGPPAFASMGLPRTRAE